LNRRNNASRKGFNRASMDRTSDKKKSKKSKPKPKPKPKVLPKISVSWIMEENEVADCEIHYARRKGVTAMAAVAEKGESACDTVIWTLKPVVQNVTDAKGSIGSSPDTKGIPNDISKIDEAQIDDFKILSEKYLVAKFRDNARLVRDCVIIWANEATCKKHPPPTEYPEEPPNFPPYSLRLQTSSLRVPQLRGMRRKAKRKAMLEEKASSTHEIDNWISCDRCGKWRRLPPEVKYDGSSKWYCEFIEGKTCDDPEDTVSKEEEEIGNANGDEDFDQKKSIESVKGETKPREKEDGSKVGSLNGHAESNLEILSGSIQDEESQEILARREKSRRRRGRKRGATVESQGEELAEQKGGTNNEDSVKRRGRSSRRSSRKRGNEEYGELAKDDTKKQEKKETRREERADRRRKNDDGSSKSETPSDSRRQRKKGNPGQEEKEYAESSEEDEQPKPRKRKRNSDETLAVHTDINEQKKPLTIRLKLSNKRKRDDDEPLTIKIKKIKAGSKSQQDGAIETNGSMSKPSKVGRENEKATQPGNDLNESPPSRISKRRRKEPVLYNPGAARSRSNTPRRRQATR